MNAGLARYRSAWVWVGLLLRLGRRRPEELIAVDGQVARASGSGETAGRTKSAIAALNFVWRVDERLVTRLLEPDDPLGRRG